MRTVIKTDRCEMQLRKKAMTIGIAVAAALAAAHPARAQMLDEPIKPLPQKMDLDARKVDLGKKLFHDKRLSKDNSLSCASCHDIAKGGADGQQSPTGVRGRSAPITTPTVLNGGLTFRRFWTARAATLVEQAAGPVHNPGEM